MLCRVRGRRGRACRADGGEDRRMRPDHRGRCATRTGWRWRASSARPMRSKARAPRHSAEIRKITGGGVHFALETSAVPAVFRLAVDALRGLGTCVLVGSARAGTEVSFEMPVMQGGPGRPRRDPGRQPAARVHPAAGRPVHGRAVPARPAGHTLRIRRDQSRRRRCHSGATIKPVLGCRTNRVRRGIRPAYGTGPRPHPATQRKYADWVAGWGSGLEPSLVYRDIRAGSRRPSA